MSDKNTTERHSPETAGSIMVHRDWVPVVRPEMTLSEVGRQIREMHRDYRTMDYIYVLDKDEKLLGVLSIKEFYVADDREKQKVEHLMRRELVSVRPHTDQEHIALLALKHSIKTVPVVDKEGRLLGVVPFDTILKILDSEAVEDIVRLGGVLHHGIIDNIFKIPLMKSFEHRIPWLLLGLTGGLLSAGIIRLFESTLEKNLIIAAFIPLIVYMADAVGTQMEAYIIRDLAVISGFNFTRYLLRQLRIILGIGLILSGLLFVASLAIYRELSVSVVLCLALFMAISTSVLTGLVVPYMFSRMSLDPANASGPIATIIQDIISVTVYFSVAAWLL